MVAEPQGGPTVDSSVDQHAIRQSTDTSHLYKNTFVWNPRQQPEYRGFSSSDCGVVVIADLLVTYSLLLVSDGNQISWKI